MNNVTIDYQYATLYLTLENDNGQDMFDTVSTYKHYGIWRRVISFLKKNKWEVKENKRITYRKFSPKHRYGKLGDLEFQVEITNRVIKFEFYQEINISNTNGGYYDFDKYNNMPYLVKKSFELWTNKIALIFANEFNSCIEFDKKPKFAEEAILKHVNSCSFTRTKQKSLKDTELFMSEYDFSQNSTDRDGKTIKCGEIKYYRCRYDGVLRRVKVYHNINNMWWSILNKFEYTNLSSWELFDPKPEDFLIRRDKKGSIPKAKLESIEKAKSLNTKELLKIIKARRLKNEKSI